MTHRRHAPAWFYVSGMLLALVAGWINAVGLLGVPHQGITHVTGTMSIAATRIAALQLRGALDALFIVACFLGGAVVSGVIIRDPSVQLGRRYGVALIVESVLLFASWALFARGQMSGEYLAAMACGLQNALATNFSGAVLRTTHMTGVITDLGLLIGHALHRRAIDPLKLRIYLVLLASFLVGGVCGAAVFVRASYASLAAPATITLLGGIGYTAHMHRRRAHATSTHGPA